MPLITRLCIVVIIFGVGHKILTVACICFFWYKFCFKNSWMLILIWISIKIE